MGSSRMQILRLCLVVFCISSLCLKESCAQSCYDDFNDIYEQESLVTDTTFRRLYVICPRLVYDIGTLDINGNVKEPADSGVVPPIPLRSNMTIRCGDNGARDNLCWFTGGDIHLDGTKVLGIMDDSLEGVAIEGFVFIGARQYSLWATKPGSITFRDCEWREFVASNVPIMLDYYDASNPSNELVVTFEKCEFRDNRYFGMGSQNSLIYGNGVQNHVIITQTLFENNDMVWNNTRPDTHSFIVESLGPTVIQNSCFQDNDIGASDVIVFGSSLTSEGNFFANSSGTLCDFAAVFETVQQFDLFTPLCVGESLAACNRFATLMPTEYPSSSPTELLSDPPSMAPSTSLSPSTGNTGAPTITPQPTITSNPSEIPSDLPSQSPSIVGGETNPEDVPTAVESNGSPTDAPDTDTTTGVPGFSFPTDAPQGSVSNVSGGNGGSGATSPRLVATAWILATSSLGLYMFSQ